MRAPNTNARNYSEIDRFFKEYLGGQRFLTRGPSFAGDQDNSTTTTIMKLFYATLLACVISAPVALAGDCPDKCKGKEKDKGALVCDDKCKGKEKETVTAGKDCDEKCKDKEKGALACDEKCKDKEKETALAGKDCDEKCKDKEKGTLA
jgi:hypothetical protein